MKYNKDYKQGLSSQEVSERIRSNLINYNDEPKTKTIKEIFRDNFFTYFNFINCVLGGAIIIAGIIGGEIFNSLKNCTFMGVIIVNSIIATIQEIISKKTIDKLSVLAASKVTVIRDGKEKQIEINEIVLDDVLKVSIGEQIACDCEILNGNVEVNEAFITGEAKPIIKKEKDTILSGSFIVSGSCYVKVIHIGQDNYISKISAEAKYNKKANSVIMNSFEKILKILSVIIVPIGILLFINQLAVTNNFTSSIFNTVAALIGMIPEGLLLLTSSVMAVSVIRLSKYHVLVQQLYCIETLARVDVICLDKTGTITEGKMEVNKIIYENTSERELSEAMSNICGAFDSQNATLKALCEKFNVEVTWPVMAKKEFSSERKYSAVAFKEKGCYYLGAPEVILKKEGDKYQERLASYSNYRVLVVAKNSEELNNKMENLDVLAFILLQDKVRSEAASTLDYFSKQKVKVKIISGDNHLTVQNIASLVGFTDAKAIDARKITDDNIDEIVNEYDIFGRVQPEQKKQIIKALKKQGHTVAMMGDGVNDVLALKEADCSISVASGSDAAKNVSQLVLLDDNFASIPHIVAEGRRTINNLERSASLLLIKTIFTTILVIICIFMKSEYFYMPIHLSLITACTISIPSFVLALEPNHEIVKGNFMLKVISKSIPPALTVVFNVVMIVLFKRQFNLDPDLTSTLIVIMTGTTGFIFLFKLCKPFNLVRSILLTFLILLFNYIIFFCYDFFDLSQINFNTIILYIVFGFCSIYVFDKLNKMVNYLFAKIPKS